MEVKAQSKNIRISPEKVNLLAAQIKKLPPQEAINILGFVNKSAAPVLKKIIKSALANAKHNFNLNESELFFKEVIVTKGPMFKRYQPISRGRAHHILKRSSHITVILKSQPTKQSRNLNQKELQIREAKSKVKNQKSE